MIFESLHKFNGRNEVPLSLTQIKQIAGRAGRFGQGRTSSPTAFPMPGVSTVSSPAVRDIADTADPAMPDETPAPGGEVTTLHKADLPLLRSLLPRPLPSITHATVDVPFEVTEQLAALLPLSTQFSELLDHVSNLARLPPHTTLGTTQHKLPLSDLIEPMREHLSLSEFDLFTYSPVNTRDQRIVDIFRTIVSGFATTGKVSFDEVFGPSKLLKTLEAVELALSTMPSPSQIQAGKKWVLPGIVINSLPLLESLHKSLVLYIWLSFRLNVAFPDRPIAVEVKARTEAVLEQSLEHLPGLKRRKKSSAEDTERIRVKAEREAAQGGKIEIDWRPRDEGERTRERWRGVGLVQPAQEVEKDSEA
jgi:ATP-dependent RNA helicase SUPV3L1/SUV3